MSESPAAPAPSEHPSLEQKKKLAKELLKATRNYDQHAALRFTWNCPRFRGQTAGDVWRAGVSLADAQHVIARESGFQSWPKLKAYTAALAAAPDGPVACFEQAVAAIIQGDLAALERLVRRRPEICTMRSARDHHAVLWHYVAANGVENEHQRTPANAVAVAELLLESGAGEVIDATADFYGGGGGSTPLVGLVTSGHPAEAGVQAELVNIFCRAGANVDGVDDDGLPLASAISFRYPLAARALAANGARVDNVVFAAALGEMKLLDRMLDPRDALAETAFRFPNPFAHLEADALNQPGAVVAEAFVYACMCGEAPAARRLLAEGVDVNVAPRKGMTALHESAFQGRLDVVRFLLTEGARADLRDEQWNSTAIGWAAEGKHKAVIDELLTSGAVDFLDIVEYGDAKRAHALLDSNPELARGAAENNMPLLTAAYLGRRAMVELLLEFGADASRKSESGHTALELAERAGRQETADVLRRAK